MEFLSSLHQFSAASLLLLRIVLGAIFIVHGPPKLQNPQQFSGGIGLPVWFIVLLGFGETLASLLMFLGLLTQIASLIMMIVMLGAIYFKTSVWKIPFSAMDKLGWEFDAMIFGGAAILLTIGGGALSLDQTILGM